MARPSKNGRSATSANTWRKNNQETFLLVLSSGNTVELQCVQLDSLIRSGRIPNLLAPIAAQALWKDPEKMDMDLMLSAESTKQYLDLIDVVVPAAVVKPRLRPLPKSAEDKLKEPPLEDEELWVDELTFVEKVEIFKLCLQPTEVLRSFRRQQERAMESLSDVQNNGSKSESDTEPVGSLDSVSA